MMKRLLAVAALLMMAAPAFARHVNPDHLAVCYLFEGNEMKKVMPCVLSSGQDERGNFFTVLHNIAPDPVRVEDNLNSQTPRMVTLNGKKAAIYSRDASGRELSPEQSYNASPEAHENFLTCFRTRGDTTSYCFHRSEM